MSEANRTAIRVSREQTPKATYGNPLFQPIRITSASIAYTPETVVSNELDPMRQIVDNPLVGFTAGGDIPAELSIGNTDHIMEGLMLNPWVRTPEVLNGASWKYGWGSGAATRISSVTTTAINIAANSVLAGTTSNNPGTVFSVGQLMYLSGFGIADQILRVAGSAATAITVAGAVAVASPPPTARVKCVGFEGAAGDIQATTTGGNALTSTNLNFTQMNLSVGQWVDFSLPGTYGFAGFSGWARVSAIAANRLSFDMVPAGFAADTAAGKTIRVFYTDSIKNGVDDSYSYTVEEEFGITVGTRYLYHRGYHVNSRTISAETKAIVTDTWNFMGMDALPITNVRRANATTLGPGTGTVLNSSTAIPLFYEGGVAVTSPNFINSFSLTFENGKRTRDAVAVLGAAGIGTGRFSVTGNLNTYFGSEVLYNKVISNEISSITVGFADPAAMRAEIHDIPKLKYSGGAPDVTGIDTDIFVPLTFQGLRDLAGGRDYTYLLSRFEYYL